MTRPRGIRPSDRTLIVGYTGCGKTELARMIARAAQPVRLIVWDPKDELDFGVPRVRSVVELAAMMHQPIVHYVPATGDRDELEEASLVVWNTPGPWLWWVDEASEVTTPSWAPRGLRLAAVQGRSSERSVLALTQRVAECHPVLRSQAEHIIVFAEEPIALDMRAIAGHVGRDPDQLANELRELQSEHGRHAHLWWVRPERDMRRCAPIPLETTRRISRPKRSASTSPAGKPTETGGDIDGLSHGQSAATA